MGFTRFCKSQHLHRFPSDTAAAAAAQSLQLDSGGRGSPLLGALKVTMKRDRRTAEIKHLGMGAGDGKGVEFGRSQTEAVQGGTPPQSLRLPAGLLGTNL